MLNSIRNNRLAIKIFSGLHLYAKLSLGLFIMFSILRLIEILLNSMNHSISGKMTTVAFTGLMNDLIFCCEVSGWLLLIFLPIYIIRRKISIILYFTIAALLFLADILLIQYFFEAAVPLGADVFGYTIADIKQTVGTAGAIKISGIIAFLILLVSFIAIFTILIKKVSLNKVIVFSMPFMFLLVAYEKPHAIISNHSAQSEYIKDLCLNKTNFFLNQSYAHFFPQELDIDIYAENYQGIYDEGNDSLFTMHYVDEQNFPFLHTDETPDVLSAFINKGTSKPNIVLILVEGLGKAFSNRGAYLGSFTPFLDSLSNHSLYWGNFLSSGGRTFAALPSILGSLPFIENGFAALGENMPGHLSLVNLLKHNGYRTSFYYGGDATFDNMSTFLKKNKIDGLFDEKTFPPDYVKMPESVNNYTWGYDDKELYRRYFQIRNTERTGQPYLSIILTVTSHMPFLISNQQTYLTKFEERMKFLDFDDQTRANHQTDKLAFSSVLFADDALRGFFKTASEQQDFNNTIFIITGDHRIPEIPMSTKLDRFHVPLIVYSPLLKRTSSFSSISTHFDITPTLLAFLKANYPMDMPSQVSWMGSAIDTSKILQNRHAYPLMKSKSEIVDFIMGKYQLHNSTLYSIQNNLETSEIKDAARENMMMQAFTKFKLRNALVKKSLKIVPDSLLIRYGGN